MIFAFASLVLVLSVALLLAVASLIISSRIDRRHPPEGELVRLAGGVMHVAERRPEGRAPLADIVLIHGASATLGDPLLALADALSARYRVLALDRPGQGWSDRPGGRRDASPMSQARRIAEALRRQGVERAVIVGHSFGASVAAALAVEEPALVQGLVFVAPATHAWPGGVAWHYRLAALPLWGNAFAFLLAPTLGSLMIERGASAVFSPQKPPLDYVARAGAALAITPKRFRANGQDIASLKRHVIALSPRYPEIAAPCAIITGDADDTVWPSIHSHGLARDIKGAKLIVLEGVGHMPHHARPDVVLAAIDEIVAQAANVSVGQGAASG
jgi:pimeloyl-ACP methyl ester carboxylesterase